MKPHLLKVKEAEGFDAYLVAIKNCVAGCKQKWKLMPKVYMLIVIGVTISDLEIKISVYAEG